MHGSDHQVPDQPEHISAYGVADSDQLAMLAKALDDFCGKHGVANEEDRERIAIKIMCLFRRGMTNRDRIAAELERAAS